MFIYEFVFFSGLFGLVMVRKHFLLCLLSLEFLIVSIYMFSLIFFSMYIYDYYFLILFLVLGVCDGVLGLSLLVYLIRKTSSDYIDILSLC
uniref:NADH-ubiquinone oxidoreductase chain 4L n=1 Tax=Plectoderini sp. SX-2018 TaxID=2507541 RepID=A0A510CQY6_9HEMI|nr:NADH dehydrogenase subunit 4L [Plectoderini sp. SX-2018]